MPIVFTSWNEETGGWTKYPSVQERDVYFPINRAYKTLGRKCFRARCQDYANNNETFCFNVTDCSAPASARIACTNDDSTENKD